MHFGLISTFLLLAHSAVFAQVVRALLVGGGPGPEHNQIAIESNMRYLLRLLPPSAWKTVLFADGDPKTETVLFEQQQKELKPGERILVMLLNGRSAAYPTSLKYRSPSLAQLDGPSKKIYISNAFDKLKAELETSPGPALLYFTGHGSPNTGSMYENNVYDLWGGGGLSVHELAEQINKLPSSQPLTLVMVQCFSGAFANLIFEGGDPKMPPVERDIAGFFATVQDRVAAGCTPAVDENDYHDFTSYFFAALTGKDRLGHTVKGADYNRDGKVTMDEAYCYTLIHDSSIDVPVCTSDIFIRRMSAGIPDDDIFKLRYRDVRSWASPGQRAALDELSKALGVSGDDRAAIAYARFRGLAPDSPRTNPMAAARRAFTTAADAARTTLLARWPDLKDPKSTAYSTSYSEAAATLERQANEGRFKELMDADKALSDAEEAQYQSQILDARQARFVRLFKTVALIHSLRETGETATKARLERLLTAEARPFLANVRTASNTRP
jgi:hypothetical protein